MQSVWQDVRFGVRLLAKHRGFTAAALITLALGIGANAAIFSLLNALFLQSLPVPDPSGLVHVYQTRENRPDDFFSLSYVDYLYYREQGRSFSDVAAHYPTAPMQLVLDDASEAVTGSVVTASYFKVLGLSPAAGRFFLHEEDRVPGRDPVAVISHALWRRRFDSNPRVAGTRMGVNGTPFTIVGVAPPGFAGVLVGGASIDVWIPSAMFRVGYRYCDALERGCTIVQLIGRLKQDRTVAEAQTELSMLARRLAAAYPEVNKGLGVAVLAARGAHPGQRADSLRTVRLLVVTVTFVLLIACANLAALLLARGLNRRKEIAIRLALGAGRERLVRQLLVETLLLSLAGGMLGLLIASWVKEILFSYFATDYAGRPSNISLDIDPIVLGATLGLSLLTGFIFGLVPALQASRPDLVPVLRDEGQSGGFRRSTLRDGLVVAQIAASIVLLVAAGLLIRSLANVYRGPGFDPNPVVLLRLRPSLVGYDVPKARAFQRRAIERLEALPGVLSASPCDYFPYLGSGGDVTLWLPGQPPDRPEGAFRVLSSKVGPRYFETLGVRLLEGREFDERDRQNAPRVAIVNEILAHRYWRNETAMGRSLIVDGQKHEVVGVVRLAQYHNLSEHPLPYLFLNYWQHETTDPWDDDSRTHVRVAGDPAAMLPTLRREIAGVDPNVPIAEDYPLIDRLHYTFKPLRAARLMLVCLGGFAVLLSAVGLYGALAFTVAQRTREIAVRVALGADRGAVVGLVLRQAAYLTVVGVGIGLGGALLSARYLMSLLYGVNPHDWLTFTAVPAVLAAVAILASYLPTRRATRVDPMIALRYE